MGAYKISLRIGIAQSMSYPYPGGGEEMSNHKKFRKSLAE
jgi:hypothetical protein